MVVFNVTAYNGVPAEDVHIDILDNDVLAYQLQTSIFGKAAVMLTAGVYTVMLSWDQHPHGPISPFSVGMIVIASGNEQLNFRIAPLDAEGSYCKLTPPTDSVKGQYTLQELIYSGIEEVSGGVLIPYKVRYNGKSINVLRGGVYNATLASESDLMNTVTWNVKIPELSQVDLLSVLFPQVVSWSLNVSSVSLVAGEQVCIPLTLAYTSGLVLQSSEVPAWFAPKSLDPTIATCSLGGNDGTLQLCIAGHAPGGTTITGRRFNQYCLSEDDILPGELGVTVT